jgi:hypothetical protein
MSEPFYIRQTADLKTPDEAREWLREAIAEARSEGATFFRASYHPEIAHLHLVEGWTVQPEDQGEVRWALTYSQDDATGVSDEVPGRSSIPNPNRVTKP